MSCARINLAPKSYSQIGDWLYEILPLSPLQVQSDHQSSETTLIDSGWFSDPCKQAEMLIEKFLNAGKIQVGSDAPRMPLTNKREWL